MRKILRSMARARMKAAGVQKINKTRYMRNQFTGMISKYPSIFAENWRKWVD